MALKNPKLLGVIHFIVESTSPNSFTTNVFVLTVFSVSTIAIVPKLILVPLLNAVINALFNVNVSYAVLLVLIFSTMYVYPATVNSLPITYCEYASNLLVLSCDVPGPKIYILVLPQADKGLYLQFRP